MTKHRSILDVFEGEYLNFADTQTWDGPKKVLIEKCEPLEAGHVFKDGKRLQRDAYELSFKGAKKRLVLNQTNSVILIKLFPGPGCKHYVGKTITLFGDKNVKNPTGGRGGVRIKF